MNGHPITDREKEMILSERAKGQSLTTIAHDIGRSISAVTNVIEEARERRISASIQSIKVKSKSVNGRWVWLGDRKARELTRAR